MIAISEMHDHQARCQRHVLALALLARDDEQPPAAAEVDRVTGAIFAEAEASARAAVAADTRAHPGAWALLLARLNRLAAATSEAVTAARYGDVAALRRHVRRLETVTSAIWTVQRAVCDPGPSIPAPRSGPAPRSYRVPLPREEQ